MEEEKIKVFSMFSLHELSIPHKIPQKWDQYQFLQHLENFIWSQYFTGFNKAANTENTMLFIKLILLVTVHLNLRSCHTPPEKQSLGVNEEIRLPTQVQTRPSLSDFTQHTLNYSRCISEITQQLK